jgi:hypothetical protein
VSLDDLMARHAQDVLFRPDHFGEEVVYRFASGAQSRTLRAVVDRLDVEASTPGSPQVGRRRAVVIIARHATQGVSTVAAGDSLLCVMREGEAAKVAKIKRIVSQDSATFTLEVES